jgi:WD40 repeat protein
LPAEKPPHEWQVGKAGIERLAFARDSQRLAAGCDDGAIHVLATPSGEVLTVLQVSGQVLDLRFSMDGTTLAYCSEGEYGSYCLDTRTDQRRGKMKASRAAITPDLKTVATIQAEGLVFYSGGTTVIVPELAINLYSGRGFACSPDSRWLAIAAADGSIELWSVPERKFVRRLPGHPDDVRVLEWSADGTILASGSYDQTVAIWDPHKGTMLRRLRGHRAVVQGVAFSLDNRTLYTGGYDASVRVWTDLGASHPDRIALPWRTWWVRITPGARFIYGAGEETANDVWFFKMDPAPHVQSLRRWAGSPLALSPDGHRFVGSWHSDEAITVFESQANSFLPV